MADNSIRQLEAKLWDSADALRAESKLTSNQYCMPVLGLIFLRYAFSRFRMVEAELLKERPVVKGRTLPITADDFLAKSALYLPGHARYDFLVNLPDDVASLGITGANGLKLTSRGEALNNAITLLEQQEASLEGVLPKDYTTFPEGLLRNLLTNFNNSALDDVKGDVLGRIYEYFLNKFAKNVAQDDGVFFTPKSLVKMIVNVLEPKKGILLDPACGSGGMFVQTGDFVEHAKGNANLSMTFYGQEKVEYNAKLCKMNMAVHGLSGKIVYGDIANSFYHDAHALEGRCDYVMANPPFNVDKVSAEKTENAGRLPFGLPAVNKKTKEVGNANYLWISYFYSYLNDHGRAGFVMASSATDSQSKDREIRQQLLETGHVDVMVSVGSNFFYTKSLPCSLWFFDKGKKHALKDKVLFIDARNTYTVLDRTTNIWTEWQLKNLNAIVWLYRGEQAKYQALVKEYTEALGTSDFTQALNDLEAKKTETEVKEKARIDALPKREQKAEKVKLEATLKDFDERLQTAREALWLTEKFGMEGTYADILGLCKIATREEIAAKNYSLTPGAYVGVAPVEDDGVDFKTRMTEIHAELASLQAEANQLMATISNNWKELGL